MEGTKSDPVHDGAGCSQVDPTPKLARAEGPAISSH